MDTLATLSESFKNVEAQTTAFQAQCEDLLEEQKRIRELADEVGTDLQYYAYLEPLTRRLNAPGAGRLVKNGDFLEMLENLNSCIEFMDQHVGFASLMSIAQKLRYLVVPALKFVKNYVYTIYFCLNSLPRFLYIMCRWAAVFILHISIRYFTSPFIDILISL